MYKFRKINFDVSKYFSHLPAYFEKRGDISLAYLFGSYVKGSVTPISDVDIAYLPERIFNFHEEMALELAVVRILHTEEVDCINLLKASLPIQYKVITTGKAIFFQKGVREFFESRILLRYFDFQPVRERYFQKMRQDIIKGGV